MARYVIDAGVVLHLLESDTDPTEQNQLLAPTLVRSEVLESLYVAVRDGDISEKVGRDRLARFAQMKMRFLGDKVLRSVAWNVAADMGWSSTKVAEYVALTKLQADAFVTLDEDLARSLKEIVPTAPVSVLF